MLERYLRSLCFPTEYGQIVGEQWLVTGKLFRLGGLRRRGVQGF